MEAGPAPDSADEQPQKKRRVTRACDQCRRRRIKCEAYPRAALDSPCVICTEAGAAAGCTFSRPAKKRGPQAGKAKSLEERCAAFERLLGYLLPNVPSLEAHVEAFVATNASNGISPSPDDAKPSSSTSHTITASDAQQAAYAASRIPELMDSVLPPLVPAREASKHAKRPASSSGSAQPKLEELAPAAGFNQSTYSALPDPSAALRGPGQPPPLLFPHTPLSLHALADAAVPDFDVGAPFGSAPVGAGAGTMQGMNDGALEVPSLPGEATRNILLDLYFNQVVQPCLPMLDKSRFLRWAAHLPSNGPSSSTAAPSNPSLLLPPSLYLAVFALSVSYLPPSSPAALSTHPSEVYACAARAHLMREVGLAGADGVRLETCQAAVVCALVDWGAGEVSRAWMLSALALSLAIHLNLHLSTSLPPDPHSLKLKTFHSILIVHTLLSLRLDRPPLTVLEDYDVPIPPVDEAENWDLWRADKGAAELRDDWAGAGAGAGAGVGAVEERGNAAEGGRGPAPALRSNAPLTFARLAQLCAVGLGILRWSVCPRRGNGQGLAAGEQERAELVAGLAGWEEQLELELRLGDAKGAVEKVGERPRWTVEMQMLVAALYLKLRPHPSFASVTLDPVPQALGLLNHVLARYRTSFTLYRSLPTLDVTLHIFSRALFEQSDYAPHHHDAVLRAYDEFGKVFPTARESCTALAGKVDEHKRELGLLRGVHPTTSAHPSPFSAPAPAPIAEPFQAFLNYSQDLGPHATPSTVLDFGSWDQTDLLVSLGLVMGPAAGAAGAGDAPQGVGAGGYLTQAHPAWSALPGWGDAGAGTGTGAAGPSGGPLPLPLPIEGVLGGAFPVQQPARDLSSPTVGSSAAGYFQPPPPLPAHGHGHGHGHGHAMAISPPARAALPDVPGAPSPFPSAAPSPVQTDAQGTDLLTRWLDRGSLGFAAQVSGAETGRGGA